VSGRVLLLALVLTACASVDDVARRGRALEARLDPEVHGYCAPEARARGLAEVAFARGASERGDPLAANAHLARADALAARVEGDADCAAQPPTEATEPSELEPIYDKPKDTDGDGLPDATDPDDDNDGISDVVDQCPLEPEDKDGVEDIDGCPE